MPQSTVARTGAAFVAALTAVTLAAGCSGNDDSKATPAPEAKPVAAATLKTALLTPADLPAGFKEDTAPAPTSAPVTGPCAELANDADPAEFTDSVKVSLAKETETTFHGVDHQVASGTTEGVTAAVKRLRESVEKCGSFTDVEDGTSMKVTVTPGTAPKLGDEAVAATMSAVAGGVTITIHFVVVRDGNVVSAVSVAGTSDDAALNDAATTKAMDKLGKI